MMGYTSDNSDLSHISSGQDSDLEVSVQSGSSGNEESGKVCSYGCDFSKTINVNNESTIGELPTIPTYGLL